MVFEIGLDPDRVSLGPAPMLIDEQGDEAIDVGRNGGRRAGDHGDLAEARVSIQVNELIRIQGQHSVALQTVFLQGPHKATSYLTSSSRGVPPGVNRMARFT